MAQILSRERGNRRPSTVDRRWRHGRNYQNFAGVHCFGNSDHHSTNGKYREEVKDMASSPRAKSEAKIVLVRCAAQDVGRLGFTLVVAVLPSVTADSRGRDGSGGVRELGINSPGVFQVRKEEIEVEDLIGDKQGR
jgi:hypothetical protein